MALSMNYLGPNAEDMKWILEARDYSNHTNGEEWIHVGDNSQAIDWTWSYVSYLSIRIFSNFFEFFGIN